MRNFLLTVMDGLRHDLFASKNGDDLSEELELENFSSLKDGGTVIPDLHTTHLQPGPAVAGMLTGLYPREHHLYGSERALHPDKKTLPDYFSDEGYATILFNGHSSYVWNGIMDRFDENLIGPLEYLITRIREYNSEGKSVFALYEPLDVRAPYLLSKFPPNDKYHTTAVARANELSDQLGITEDYKLSEAHAQTSKWQVPLAGDQSFPLWRFMIKVVHRHLDNESDYFKKPVELLREHYNTNLELIDRNIFQSLDLLFTESEISDHTTLFLTSNSSDGPTTDENEQTDFGQRRKTIEDAVKVPGFFRNLKNTTLDTPDKPLSHVDLAPTILQEFEIDYEKADFSGSSISNPPQSRYLYVEASKGPAEESEEDEESNSVDSTESLAPDKSQSDKPEEAENVDHSVITWSSIIDNDGFKLNRKGLPVTKDDFQRPIDEFLRRVIAKTLTEWLTDKQVHERVKKFEDDDSLVARKQLVHKLTNNREDKTFELFNWREDQDETNELIDNEVVPQEKLEEMINLINSRFDDPYDMISPPIDTEREIDALNYKKPIKAVGYIE